MPFSILTAVTAALGTGKTRFFALLLTSIIGVAIVLALAFGVRVFVGAPTAMVLSGLVSYLTVMAQYALLGGDVRGTPHNPLSAWWQAITHLPHLLCASIPFTILALVVTAGPLLASILLIGSLWEGFVVAGPLLLFLGMVALPLPFLAITDGRWFSAFPMAVRIVSPIFFQVLAGFLLLNIALSVLSALGVLFFGLGAMLLADLWPAAEGPGTIFVYMTMGVFGFYTLCATMAYAAYVFEQASVVENAAKN